MQSRISATPAESDGTESANDDKTATNSLEMEALLASTSNRPPEGGRFGIHGASAGSQQSRSLTVNRKIMATLFIVTVVLSLVWMLLIDNVEIETNSSQSKGDNRGGGLKLAKPMC